jgi:hypothetical protein
MKSPSIYKRDQETSLERPVHKADYFRIRVRRGDEL